jgi:hypothetical protein
MGTAVKNKINPHFKSKYADLEALRDAADPILEKYGLMVENELVYTKENGHVLYTNLVHAASDQWKNYSQMLISPAKINDPQSFGAFVTYVERYAYKLVTGINVSDETDDDGERANKWQRQQPVEDKQPAMQTDISNIVAQLQSLPGEGKKLEAWLIEKAEIENLLELPASRVNWALSIIKKAKERDGNA